VKKLLAISLIIVPFLVSAQQTKSRKEKKSARKEKINQLIKQEEEGALIFNKQNLFAIKLPTDGFSIFFEKGKYKTTTKTNLWWIELGEKKERNQERQNVQVQNGSGAVFLGNSFVYGKENNFYQLKIGFGQQKLLGGKGNKNGVAVSAIYGGGLSLGLMKPYYVQIVDPTTNDLKDIRYKQDSTNFLDPQVILGGSGFTRGFGEINVVPGITTRAALRFDYGRYNEVISALEVGINTEYYFSDVNIMVNTPRKLFFNAYVAIQFGKRKY
jgi:hypothetical protein